MSKTVIVLGAGASAAAGVPTMATFLDRAEGILHGGQIGDDLNSFELAFRAISELQTIYAKATIDTDNLEAVFVAFEMAGLLFKLGSLGHEKIRELPRAMRRVIVRTIEETMQFPLQPDLTGGTGAIGPPIGYAELAQFCKPRVDDVTLITFNYDYGLDYALASASVPVDYCLERSAGRNGVALLKLHGSLLWEETGAGKIVPRDVPSKVTIDAFKDLKVNDTSTRMCLTAGDKATQLDTAAFSSAIVPPTWDKARHRVSIQEVWQTAAARLAEAENILVSGFSLPSSDDFFKYLYALGSAGRSRLKRFWVCEPHPTEELIQRFLALLGPTARARFKVSPMRFEQMASSLRDGDLSRLEQQMDAAVRNYVRDRYLQFNPFEQQRVEQQRRQQQNSLSMLMMLDLI